MKQLYKKTLQAFNCSQRYEPVTENTGGEGGFSGTTADWWFLFAFLFSLKLQFISSSESESLRLKDEWCPLVTALIQTRTSEGGKKE